MNKSVLIYCFFIYILINSLDIQARPFSDKDVPDFDFPQKVIADANKELNTALRNGDGISVVKHLIKSSIAENIISYENIPSVTSRVDSIAAIEKDACTESLLYHLEALIFQSYYNSNKYIINERRYIENADISDMTLWDKMSFSNKILGLVKKSLSNPSKLQKANITDYSDIISDAADGVKLYPTLFDMLSYQNINILNDLYFNTAVPQYIDSIYRDIEIFHAADIAPFINARSRHLKPAEAVSEMETLYKKYYDNEDCYFALAEFISTRSDTEALASYKDYLNRFPQSVYVNNIKNKIELLKRPSCYIKYNKYATSVDSIKVSVNATNLNDFTILVYRLPSEVSSLSRYKKPLSSLSCVYTSHRHIDGTIPFNAKQDITMPPLPYGRYQIVLDFDDSRSLEQKIKECLDPSVFHVSDISLFSINSRKGSKVFAVNSTTGVPIKGVSIISDKKEFKTLKTNAKGYVQLECKSSYAHASYADDIYSNKIYISKYFDLKQDWGSIDLFTDLAIYHPGDSINYSAICYYYDKDSRILIKDAEVMVSLSDSNRKVVATDTITTDEYGRISSSFVIPSDRMNGTFFLYAENIIGNNHPFSNSKPIQVSEYKAPTFFIEFDDNHNSFKSDTPVVITGKVSTFSGMPLANTALKCSLSYQLWSWWFRSTGSGEEISSFTVSTANDGSFSITIPAGTLNDSIDYSTIGYNKKVQYMLNVSATDAVGETQSCDKLFWIGSHCYIEATEDFTFCPDSPIKLPIVIKCSDSDETEFNCSYTIFDKYKSTVTSGTFAYTKPVVDLSALASGQYSIIVKLVGDTCSLVKDLVLYRPNDNMPPVESALWIPSCSKQVNTDNVASILLGVSFKDSHVYCIASSKNKIIREEWLLLKPGIHNIKFHIPNESDEFVDVTFITTRNGISSQYSTRFNSVAKQNPITIKPVVFRDNLVANATENWTFQIIGKDGKWQKAAFLCEMFDKAINSIAPNNWSFSVNPYFSPLINSDITNPGSNITNINFLPAKGLSVYSCPLPYLYLYGFNKFGRSYRIRMMKASINRVHKNEAVLEDAVYNTSTTFGEIVPSAKSSLSLNDVTVRTTDVATAFWKPALVTDNEGNVAVSFTVPNFNTTWLFQAIAYTADLRSASINKEVFTSKPIMVKPRLPRFLRQGDKVTLSASLMNSTDSVQTCDVMVELFSPDSNVAIACKRFNETLSAHDTKAISIEWNVPDTLSYVGYRIKAATSTFGDGEQNIIPVLQSISPVIESTPFYLDATTSHFSLNLPKLNLNSRVTLEYCNNPMWYCITALPSIKSDDYLTSTSLAHSLYAIVLGRGIANSNPDIRLAVDYWKSHNSDSTLISRLCTNSDLKIGTLLASPWINDADKQTLRMQAISDLFDAEKSSTEIAKIIKALKGLQMSDGGFAWVVYDGAISSVYATYTVLELIGELRHLGYLKDDGDVNEMIKKAIAYYDKCFIDSYNKRIDKLDFRGLSDFVYLRTLYSEFPMSATVADIHRHAVNAMKKEWKGMNLSEKAFFAIALNRNGEKPTARAIMESIRQYAITSSSAGMYWDNISVSWYFFRNKIAVTSTILQAMNEIEPENADIPLICKWILLQKQTEYWGDSSLASDAVFAILSCTDWIGKQSAPSITINSAPLQCDTTDVYLGYFKRTIPVKEANKAILNINRTGSSPAWGAVYSQYSAPMETVKAKSVDDLSITKEIYVLENNNLIKRSNLKAGDHVKIHFVIKNKRALEYVTLNDERGACFEPTDQLSKYVWADGLGYYLEVKDSASRLFFSYLPKGTHVISYDLYVTDSGTFNVGIATIQCQYAPHIVAHTSGSTITVE